MNYSIDDLLKSPFEKIKRISEDGYEYWSAKMRIKNFEYIDTKTTGLSNYGKISEEVYVELKNNSQKEQYIISEFKNKFRF